MIELEITEVVISSDGKSAIGLRPPHKNTKFKIQEIMLGAGYNRKAIPWTKAFIYASTECRAEILENGKIRII